MLKPVLKLARRIVETVTGNRWLLLAVLLINVAGFFFGLYYYWQQIGMTPWYLWLAVPDCPLYALFMAIAIALILAGKPWNTFNAVTAVGSSMYGAWTIIVLLWFGEYFFQPDYAFGSWERLISHGGLMLEGCLLLPYLTKTKWFSWGVTAVWFAVLDGTDYFYHFTYDGLPMRTNPLAVEEYYHLVNQGKVDALVYLTFGLSIAALILMIVLSKAYGKRLAHEGMARIEAKEQVQQIK